MKKHILYTIEYEDEKVYESVKRKVLYYCREQGIRIMFRKEYEAKYGKEKRKALALQNKKEYKSISYEKLLYLKREGNKVRIYTTDGNFCFRQTFGKIMEDPNANDLIMPHRSYLVNKNKIVAIENNNIYLAENTEPIPISKRNQTHILDKMRY